MSSDSPQQDSLRPAHPLALDLIERLRETPGALVLEIGRGSGRNRRALERAGFRVVEYGDEPDVAHGAAISTHALLHGTPVEIDSLLNGIAGALETNAPFYVTFGSVRDARFGEGEKRGPFTFAPLDGDEAGVAHTFYDEARLRAALEARWIIESLEERDVDEIAGSWAHREKPLQRSAHWFARLRRR